MHFPSHIRQSMLDWLDAGLPEHATVEENYVRREVPAPDMLRGFLEPTACSDTLPKDYAARIGTLLGYDGPTAGLSYATAASALLAAMSNGADAGAIYLESVLVDARERELYGPPAQEVWERLGDADRRALMDASREAALPPDLARKLVSLGVRVWFWSWSNGPFSPAWPHGLLRFVAQRRREMEASAHRAGR